MGAHLSPLMSSVPSPAAAASALHTQKMKICDFVGNRVQLLKPTPFPFLASPLLKNKQHWVALAKPLSQAPAAIPEPSAPLWRVKGLRSAAFGSAAPPAHAPLSPQPCSKPRAAASTPGTSLLVQTVLVFPGTGCWLEKAGAFLWQCESTSHSRKCKLVCQNFS